MVYSYSNGVYYSFKPDLEKIIIRYGVNEKFFTEKGQLAQQ